MLRRGAHVTLAVPARSCRFQALLSPVKCSAFCDGLITRKRLGHNSHFSPITSSGAGSLHWDSCGEKQAAVSTHCQHRWMPNNGNDCIRQNHLPKCWQQLGNCVHSCSIYWLKSRLHSLLCLQEFPKKCASLSLAKGVKQSAYSLGKQSLDAKSQWGRDHLCSCSTGLGSPTRDSQNNCRTQMAVGLSRWQHKPFQGSTA